MRRMTDNARLDLRLPAEDRENFEAAAKRAGDRNVSAWALRVLRRAEAGIAFELLDAPKPKKSKR